MAYSSHIKIYRTVRACDYLTWQLNSQLPILSVSLHQRTSRFPCAQIGRVKTNLPARGIMGKTTPRGPTSDGTSSVSPPDICTLNFPYTQNSTRLFSHSKIPLYAFHFIDTNFVHSVDALQNSQEFLSYFF